MINQQPPVSCICLTYGRPHVLEEAIHSFLLQDYAGSKELIVLNDYSGQTLSFDHPEVQVINCPKRFRTVGEKMNAAVALASHDLLFVWDDDDIFLPHRLRFSVEHYDDEKGFFKTDKAWLWTRGQLSGPSKNLFHVASCWSRRLFNELCGYPAEGTGYDLVFENRMTKRWPILAKVYKALPEEIYYIYRWGGTGSYHMSGFGYYQAGGNVGHDKVEAFVQQRASRGEIPQGDILLQPNWKTDYRQLVASYLTSSTEQQPTPNATA